MAGLYSTSRILSQFPLSGPSPYLDPPIKRKAYFSFHYDDVMRVNNVRNAWSIKHPASALMRSFYDSSMWESKKITDPETIKRLIRENVCHTSAVCVLVGTNTWWRRWVKYEIARAVIDGRGILAVHINGLNHHETRTPHAWGPNPLAFMAVARLHNGYYLYEWRNFNTFGPPRMGWGRYADYTFPVKIPRWMPAPAQGQIVQLSQNTAEHDYVGGKGHANVGTWIDRAAQQAGR